jgi:hypothetical protein
VCLAGRRRCDPCRDGGDWVVPEHLPDKYCREAVPELASTRKRIKARFNASAEPVRFFFLPKWGINHELPDRPVLGEPSLLSLLADGS